MVGLASPFVIAEVLSLALTGSTPRLVEAGIIWVCRLEFLQSLLYDLLLPFLAYLLVLNLRNALLDSVDQGHLVDWVRKSEG